MARLYMQGIRRYVDSQICQNMPQYALMSINMP